MKLADLVKTKASRVLGIDASTNSVAFCLMENDKPLKWGKINFVGQDIYEKIHDAKIKTSSMLDELKSDYIATGHYAKIYLNKEINQYNVYRSFEGAIDQSHLLLHSEHHLNQSSHQGNQRLQSSERLCTCYLLHQ